jgi:two-component system chemotaxis response regulator CheB
VSSSWGVAIGASAGGVEALSTLLAGLPPDLPAAIFVVMHLSPESESVLPRILGRCTGLVVRPAANDQPIEPGHVYVAPPDAHVLVRDHRVELSGAPRQNGFRPALDPLFRTVAVAYRRYAIGVVLSGSGDDGSAGLRIIHQCGGITIVQDPRNALFSAMPANALEATKVDYCRPLGEIAPLLDRLCREPRSEGPESSAQTECGPEVEQLPWEKSHPPGKLISLTCPECGGPLFESRNGKQNHYTCLVGHSYSLDGLDREKTRSTEGALWTAVRVLDEQAELARRISQRLGQAGRNRSAARYQEQIRQAKAAAKIIRQLLLEETIHEEGVPQL